MLLQLLLLADGEAVWTFPCFIPDFTPLSSVEAGVNMDIRKPAQVVREQ